MAKKNEMSLDEFKEAAEHVLIERYKRASSMLSLRINTGLEALPFGDERTKYMATVLGILYQAPSTANALSSITALTDLERAFLRGGGHDRAFRHRLIESIRYEIDERIADERGMLDKIQSSAELSIASAQMPPEDFLHLLIKTRDKIDRGIYPTNVLGADDRSAPLARLLSTLGITSQSPFRALLFLAVMLLGMYFWIQL